MRTYPLHDPPDRPLDPDEASLQHEAARLDPCTPSGGGHDHPSCRCGHARSAHAMRHRRIDGQHCLACPCTSYSPRQEGDDAR